MPWQAVESFPGLSVGAALAKTGHSPGSPICTRPQVVLIFFSGGKGTLHRAPVGQGPSGPDWLAISFGFWSGRALATGTAWAGLCLIHHHHFREVNPASSEMARQKLTQQGKTKTKTFRPWRIVAIRIGPVRYVRTPRPIGAATGLMAHFRCGLWGWLANAHSRRGSRACVARIDRRVTGEQQVCFRTTREHSPTPEGEWRMARAPP